MNIVFVDDHPVLKVKGAIKQLSMKIKFNHSIFKCSNSALRYIMKNLSDIDLIVLDLGLPKFDDDPDSYNKYEGLFLLKQILQQANDMPVIINSSTIIKLEGYKTESDYLKQFGPAIIEHVEQLNGYYLFEFIKTYLRTKIELI